MGERSEFHTLATVHLLTYDGTSDWNWQPLGGGSWAALHLFHEPADDGVGHYRIVAWVNNSGDVLVNSNITTKTSFREVADDFAQFTDEAGSVFGICFPDPEKAKAAIQAFEDTYTKLHGPETIPEEPQQPSAATEELELESKPSMELEVNAESASGFDLSEWLKSLGDDVATYETALAGGFQRVSLLSFVNEQQLVALGVQPAHVIRILSAICEIPSSHWLADMNLMDYSEKFTGAGIDTIGKLATLSREQLESVGIEASHISMILDLTQKIWREPTAEDAAPAPLPPLDPERRPTLERRVSNRFTERKRSLAPPPVAPPLPSLGDLQIDEGEPGKRLTPSLAEFDNVQRAVEKAIAGELSFDSAVESEIKIARAESSKELLKPAEEPPPPPPPAAAPAPAPATETETVSSPITSPSLLVPVDSGNLRPSVGDEGITRPLEVEHKVHIRYDFESGQFAGLPQEWQSFFNKQFGLPLAAVPKKQVEGYNSPIPIVLEMMREYLYSAGGLESVGIFRLAPDGDECAAVKKEIDAGTFEKCNDVNVIANLIKVWFRELPTSLLNCVDPSMIKAVCDMTDDEIPAAMEGIEEPNKSIYFWLLDVMSEVVKRQDVNKMGARNNAIVMSPNLYGIDHADPMEALTFSQKVAEFTFLTLKSRLKTKHGLEVSG